MGRSLPKPWVLVSLGILLAPATAFALRKPRPEDRVLPNFDTRFLGPRLSTALPETERALDDLRRRIPRPVEARLRPTGTVRLLSARDGGLTPPSAEPPENIARGFLRQHRDLFGLTEAEVTGLAKGREYRSRDLRLRHVRFDQSIDGIPVFEGVLSVHVDDEGRVVFVSNNGVTDPDARPGARRAPLDPALSPEEAIRIGLENIRPELTIDASVRSAPAGRGRRATFDRGPLRRDITIELEYFPAQPRPRLAWRMLLEPEGFPQAYDILVDASSGDVLYRRNRVLYADGVGTVVQSAATNAQDPRRPDEHPAGSGAPGAGDLATGCPPVDGYATRDLTGPFRDPATVLGGTGRLSGNNVRAYRVFDGTFGALGTTDPEGVWHFEYPFNTASSAETHLFFTSNFLHDFFYDLGFDEPAGNFQSNNFGRGGVGGDPLTALARADGRNNATFDPQPEGTSPIMSMFLFDALGCWSQDVDGDGAPDLDGDYDFDIVIHEFHHGVSWRLNTNFTGDEADAIGEGGSDFFAYSINNEPRLAEYVVPPDGIRQVNFKTYADWFCFDFFGFFFFCEPHDNGEIWANVLWDLREQFRADLVKGSEASAINEAHQLYVDGLKLSPGTPTMLDLRDAMLQADLLRNPSGAIGGSDNYCRMWWAFAGRGMGSLAQDTHDTGDGTTSADFTVPAACPAPPPKPVVTVTASDDGAAEAGVETGAFTFTRTGDTSAALVVSYVVGGGATPGSDYVALTGSVTIPVGAAEATVFVTPVDDTQVEADESVDVELSQSFSYVIGTPALASVTIVSEDVAPNLRVTLLAPPVGGAGDALVLTDTTSNPGTDAAPASTTRFYLSGDAEVDAGDVLLGSRAVPPLAIGASSTASTSVTLPAATAPGEYFVIAQADADATIVEISEDDNLGAAVVRVGPDLVVSAMAAPPVAGAGEAASVTETTRNVGGGSAASSVTKIYLSSNAVLDAADTLLGSRAVAALAAGASSSVTTEVTIPAGTAPGGYFLIAYADGDSAVPETIETNNANQVFVVIGPDLVVQSVTGPTGAAAGASITVNDTTRNQGSGAAAASSTKFYLSTNGALDAGDALLGSRAVPSLAGGAGSSAPTSVLIPAGTAAGPYYVLAKADGDLAVPETQEGNNVALFAIQIGADLVIPSVTAPATAGAGLSISVSDTTRNTGGGEAAASVTRLYLSLDAVLDAGDTLLGSRAVPLLAAGASDSGGTLVTIPAGTPPGLRWVIAQADGEGTLAETSETNNVNYVMVVIGPDLTLAALTGPAAAGAGSTIAVSDTTQNQGAGMAAASSTHFYLSTNGVLDAVDVLLGSRSVPSLAGGAGSSGTTPLGIPAATSAGTYYLIAKADGDLAVPETQEGNNLALFAIQVGADLVITGVTAPATAGAGLSISVSDTTRNAGGADAAASVTRFYLSSDAVLDAGDSLLGSRAVPLLAAGASDSGSTSLTIPAGTPPGLRWVIAQADGEGTLSEISETNNVNYVSLVIGPDLIVQSLTAPAAAGAGSSIAVNDTTRNQGAGSAAASATHFYLSSNASLDGADTLLGSRAVAALAGGASSSGTTALTVPAATAAGTYYVIGKADGDLAVPETQEGNNVALSAIQIGADLVVTSVTAPPTAGAGAPISVSDTTRNQGGADAAASATRFYLSSDAILDAADTLLGARSVPLLGPGASSSGSTSVTIPAAIGPGSYYLLAQADGSSAVAETSETNNVNFAFLIVGPDLIVSSLTAPAAAGAGAAISVSDTTRNQGAGPAAASTTRFYLSSNTSVDGADVLLGSRAVPALAAGVNSSAATSLTLPAGTAAGPYFILAQADGDGVVAETTEGNNVGAASISIGPDLVVLSVTAPASAAAGASITVNDTTRNSGAGVAAASTTRFYLSTNGTLDGGDAPLGSRAVPALAGATSSSAATAVSVPASAAPGTYYVIAQADADGVLPETAESNNTAYAAIVIGSDLVIAPLTAPATGGAGAPLNVTDTTRNQGAGVAGASSTRLYLSADPMLDAGDALLGSRAVPALAAGTSSTGTTSVTIPAATPPGTRYVLAQADADGVVAETLEGNNVSYVAVAIGPDLLVQSVSGPAGAGAGTTISVNDTTRNQGGGAAAASATRFYLSANSALDASDTLLGSRSVPALAAATNSSGSTSLTIPLGTASGTYYLIAQADGDGAVSETSEANNNAAATILIGPDLVISSVTGPGVAGAGVTINVTDTTRNQGGAAGASSTRIHFSTNAVLDAGDTLLGARAVPALAAGATSTGTTAVTLPAGTGPGFYYVIAQADGDGALLETNEGNNVSYVGILIGPDMVMQALSAPTASGPGATINVSDTTRNQGGGLAAASATRFYLSANTVIDGTDTLLGARAVPELAPSTNSAGTTALTIPAGVAPGPYYLIARADGELAVPETYETNNTALAAIAIGPDLIVPSVSAPASVGAGATVNVTDTTRNSGGSDAPPTLTRLYLSTNPTVDAGDVLLGTRSVAALAPGTSSTATTSVTIPAGTLAGTYFILAKADADGTLAEVQEINNVNYVLIQVFLP